MNAFTLINATTAGAAVRELQIDPGALTYARLNEKRPLGGGSDLLAEIKDGLFAPKQLVNLKPIADFHGIQLDGGELRIGATTTISEIAESADIQKEFTALADSAHHVGSEQIRNQGTVGGNLCQRPRCWYYRNVDTVCLKKGGQVCFAVEGENKYHAIFGNGAPCHFVSSTNLGVALLALDGIVHVQTAAGEKAIPAAEFFRMPTPADPYRETVLEPGEIVSAIHVPKQEGRRSAYLQFSEKAEFDWALVSAAVGLTLDAAKNIADIRLALNAVAPVPWRLKRTEDFLRGKPASEDNLREAARLALADAKPLSQNAYKVQIARALIVRVIQQALA